MTRDINESAGCKSRIHNVSLILQCTSHRPVLKCQSDLIYLEACQGQMVCHGRSVVSTRQRFTMLRFPVMPTLCFQCRRYYNPNNQPCTQPLR